MSNIKKSSGTTSRVGLPSSQSVDKEAILKAIFERYCKNNPDKNYVSWADVQKDGEAGICYEAMDEYAASLIKENEGLKAENFSLTARLNSLGHLTNALNQELEQLKLKL